MTGLLDKLNLTPAERRLVVIVGLVVFVVLNVWLVWPQFGQVTFWQNRLQATQTRLKQFNDEIQRRAEYDKELAVLQNLGLSVADEDRALTLQREVTSQAALSGVAVENYQPAPRASTSTNAFFDEQTLVITFSSMERELVDFLESLGVRNSLIRVKSMNLQPDPSRTRLRGTIMLVMSFQRKAPARSVAATVAAAVGKPTNPAPARVPSPPAKTETKPASAPPAPK